MGRFRTRPGPGQVYLMDPDPREWLPPGHLAWAVMELAGEMDLSGSGARYRADRQGGRPYDPQMMITLVLYCYCRGRRQSREIEMATWDDVGARIICGGLHPDHSTVADFIRRHFPEVCALLPESVKACAREGLVSVDLVAGDGTKLKANASMAANRTGDQLDAEIAALEAQIRDQVRQWAQDILGDLPGDDSPGQDGDSPGQDSADGDGSGGDSPGQGGADDGDGDGAGAVPGRKPGRKKKPPQRPEQVLAARQAARRELEARQADPAKLAARADELAQRLAVKEAALAVLEKKAAARISERARRVAAGEKIPGRRDVITSPGQDRDVRSARAARDKLQARYQDAAAAAAAPAPRGGILEGKVNTSDPASRVMLAKKGGSGQLVNVQALATARTQVILAIMRHDSPADVQALIPLLRQARCVLRQAGILDAIAWPLSDTGYASDANFTSPEAAPARLLVAVVREARQTGRSADGRDPAQLDSWAEMTELLSTPEGKALYRQRAGIIEPVFAQLTARLGRALHYRGIYLDAGLALWAASHNILKAIHARTRRRSAAPAAA
jgi:transposase